LSLVVCIAIAPASGRAVTAVQPSTPGQLPELTEPVTDLAGVIDAKSRADLDQLIRRLQKATGDVVVVVTVPAIEPFADSREYAVRLFENRGKGIGEKGKDNGLLVLVAPNQRTVWVEVGYGLEQWITDGFSGETSREYMRPHFRNGQYGAGLVAGVRRIISRIAEGRGVTLEGVERPARPERGPARIPYSTLIFLLFMLLLLIGGMRGGPRRGVRRWGRSGWSGWSSGVGPFSGGWSGGGRGGFGGGFGGFGGGRSGGFGGFGGGRSGGGGGGASW
jgi:uncharacterized protein